MLVESQSSCALLHATRTGAAAEGASGSRSSRWTRMRAFSWVDLSKYSELGSVGVSLVLYPLSAHRAMAKAAGWHLLVRYDGM